MAGTRSILAGAGTSGVRDSASICGTISAAAFSADCGETPNPWTSSCATCAVRVGNGEGQVIDELAGDRRLLRGGERVQERDRGLEVARPERAELEARDDCRASEVPLDQVGDQVVLDGGCEFGQRGLA